MRTIALLILVFTFQVALIQATSCGDNPFILEFQQFISEYSYDSELQVLLNTYLTQSPAAIENTLCIQTKENSCCSLQFEQKLISLTNLFYKKYSSIKFVFGNLLTAFGDRLYAISTNTDKFVMPESMTTGDIVATIKSYRLIILKLLKAHLKFLRGNLCVLCVAPSDYTTYIYEEEDQKSVILNQEDFVAYMTEVATNLQSLDTLKAELITSLTEYKEYFDLIQDKTQATYALSVITDFIDYLNFCPGNLCANYTAFKVGIFQQTILNELRDIEPPTSTEMTESTRLLRNMQVAITNQNYQLSSDGLNTYLPDSSDQKLAYEGVDEYVVTSFGEKLRINCLWLSLLLCLSLFLITQHY